MPARGVIVQPKEGAVWNVSSERSLVLKLVGEATAGSLMLFEESVPAGTKSWFHLHHHSDEVAYVLSGEVTFRIGDEVSVGGPGASAFIPRGVQHAWKSSDAGPARLLFIYTPATAGGMIEEQMRAPHLRATGDDPEAVALRQRHGWEIVGPNPL